MRMKMALKDAKGFFQEGPEQLDAVKSMIEAELENDPSLKDVKVVFTPGHTGAYDPQTDTIYIGVINPAVFAHEIGHAKNLRNSAAYRGILGGSRLVNSLASGLSLPATLAIRTMVADRQKRNEIFNLLTTLTAMSAAPTLAEELSASMDAVRHSDSKLDAVKSLLPAYLSYLGTTAVPIGIYQYLGKQ
jgi:Zn-dependent membrane protease YugP